MMGKADLRNDLYRTVYESFVGPFDHSAAEMLEKWDNPLAKYSIGILYPIGAEMQDNADKDSRDPVDNDLSNTEGFDSEEGVVASPKFIKGLNECAGVTTKDGLSECEYGIEEPISLSNARNQSAVGFTFSARSSDLLKWRVSFATYERVAEEKFRRCPRCINGETRLPQNGEDAISVRIENTDLKILIVHRFKTHEGNAYTIAVINTRKIAGDGSARYDQCYFQVKLELESDQGFFPLDYPHECHEYDSKEEVVNRLLYRDLRNYASGHGCATDWSDDNKVTWISTDLMPTAEVKPVRSELRTVPSSLLRMSTFSNEKEWDKTEKSINLLCDAYEEWINEKRSEADSLDEPYHDVAHENIQNCASVLSRMRNGARLLHDDAIVRKAFIQANRAMYDQYLHYSVVSGNRKSIKDQEGIERSWRPFQLAFILMNIGSFVDVESEERQLLDLIWFPTGGGKTEAYLGLTAFVLLYERLTNSTSDGITVLMRYTLRLLTSQQFLRAATLVCALESMRRTDTAGELGERPFAIGLWAGSDVSPNYWKQAISEWQDYSKKGAEFPFPVIACPWCGEDLRRKGYKKERGKKCGRESDYILTCKCSNPDCEYHGRSGLPIQFVDEDLYEFPPSILISTVDKLAQLPYRPESYALFGKGESAACKPPKLIIQDELHLITGPLGSMMASYETLVDELCTARNNQSCVKPKIVASTATISHAAEQCHALFGIARSNIVQFPPAGLDQGDSFFAIEDSEGDGRLYVGVYAPSAKSYATASIQLYTELLWRPVEWDVDETERDPYWSVMGYYSTLRELGQAATWASGDLVERLRQKMKTARQNGEGLKRYLDNYVELTGRLDSSEVGKNLKNLEKHCHEDGCIDLCLATNMISVGLDVTRLGIMLVAGQPKTTAEYIQATSRVGRGSTKGVVFVLYGTQRPRDRSHYEQFKQYHQSFYANVEPSSITPFCFNVRKRTLAGVLIGLYRSLKPDAECSTPEKNVIGEARRIVTDRVELIDSFEVDSTMEELAGIEERWSAGEYQVWGSMNPHRKDEKTPLMDPGTTDALESWSHEPFKVPTAMRNVDAECGIMILGEYS